MEPVDRPFVLLNWACFFGGMFGVWRVTHSGSALLFAFLASLHFVVRARE